MAITSITGMEEIKLHEAAQESAFVTSLLEFVLEGKYAVVMDRMEQVIASITVSLAWVELMRTERHGFVMREASTLLLKIKLTAYSTLE
ncbi:hypothetical protein [Paenibacillus alvei]|uniref:hypothetical protein n=1 Tax=Paenibacillus alvei TaxID=44250 RepID=UPI0018CD6AE0|nr:hypothetical protein [Paenibacillus alvei]MBG9734428.1 hypothetical protein [Paenibacillus alvei]MBG9744269.1 hypothetical protein [Paenibacillus alvei]MCY9578052.1 hypothetical protein [Paenibacillus alvei]MCY9585346.1 hypothetical protein [Paenibacillus alvei]